MPLTLDKIRPLKIMKTKLIYPESDNDRLRNSVVFILTKNLDDSIDFLQNNSILVNRSTFKSYYTERDYSFYTESSNTRDSIINSILESSNPDYYQLEERTILPPDLVETLALNEDFSTTQNYPAIFRRFLYTERIKNHKEMLAIYKKVKSKVDFITNTKLSIGLYRQKNLIVDWSYYADLFFKNNTLYKLDKSVDLLHHMMTRFINDTRLKDHNYTKRTVIIPVRSWNKELSVKEMFDYRKDVNPFSMIFRLLRKKNNLLDDWSGIDFIVASNNTYYKIDFSDFLLKDMAKLIFITNKMVNNDISDIIDDDSDPTSTTNTTPDVAINKNATPYKGVKLPTTDTKYIAKVTVSNDKPLTKEEIQKKEEEPEAERELGVSNDEEWMKDLINELNEPTVDKISDARKARMEELDKKFKESTIEGKKVGAVLKEYYTKERELEAEEIPIDSLNEEWKNIKSIDFNSSYNIDEDIIAIINSLKYKSRPLSVVSMDIKDTSTYTDYVRTLTVVLEDVAGTRSKLVIDIPKLINSRFMKIRGNKKSISGQLMLMPIIKTAEDTSQIVTSYHKIMIYRISPANGSKTTKDVNRLLKAIYKYKEKYPSSKMELFEGDNSASFISKAVPVEYADLASSITKIEFPNGSYVNLNYTQMHSMKPDNNFNPDTDIIYGFDAKKSKPIYDKKSHIARSIAEFLCSQDTEFAEVYDAVKATNKLSFSSASIMNTNIPVIVLMAYCEGLQKALDKAKVQYRYSEKRPKLEYYESAIKFSDGYLVFNDESVEHSLLLAGLSKTDFSGFSIKDINTKTMWLDVLDEYGGRIKADGLDNFYDCEFDPMSIDICKRYKLPYDFVEALAYANNLLANTGFNEHGDIRGNRIRTNEVIAGYFYQVIANAYGEYSTKSKRTGRGIKMSIKQSALIDIIMKDPGFSDLSVNTPLLEADTMNNMSFKGLSGMNADRAYTLDKRLYDESMLGILGMSTGFSANVGMQRIATVDSSIKDGRGIIQPVDKKDLSTLKALTIYEALAPYGTTHDDPMRTSMGYVQTTKHSMRVKYSTPNLITYGMDEALPYFTSNVFSYKVDGVKGKVLSVTDDELIFEQISKTGEKSRHVVSLKEQVMKNSDGGFYVTVRLKPMVKKGDTLKHNQIIAYDPTSYSPAVAKNPNQSNISYNIGTLAKVAIMCTDEAYEDSSIINNRLSDALTSFYCVEKLCSIDADSNVFDIIEVGKTIEEGSPLIVFQNAFDDKDANILLRNIADDELELISDFGRINIRSKITGVVQDIRIIRTCDIKDLSPSLKSIVTKYESKIKKKRDEYRKAGVSELELRELLPPTEKLEPVGKLKNTPNGVLFEFYIKCRDKMGIGDKLVYNTAIKGTIKDIIPEGEAPYTDFRPDEEVDALLTSASVNARMAVSIINGGALNKALIELTRQCKDILGIPWTNLTNGDNLD